ncbi:MAG TPA: ParB/RepB/Spo0J family partition protein [Candidatus Limnocylindrales bacterium]
MARPDFRAAAARRLSEERELSPTIVSLLSAERAGSKLTGVRTIALDLIVPNPDQPRMVIDEASLHELSASVREHGILQPILVRPLPDGRFQLIAGERRWRASREAGLDTIPALVEEIDDDTALEIAIIENLQREDLSPLEEAGIYDRMIREHGYSIRRLAQKLGKDKGYLENRLRLADAPPEIRELVSLRRDTLSHAYELLKVSDPRKRKRLAGRVARGELTLIKLRERIEGRPTVRRRGAQHDEPADNAIHEPGVESGDASVDDATWAGTTARGPLTDEALVDAKQRLAEAVEALVDVLRAPDVVRSIGEVDRANLAKYLTIAKLRLENAIAMVRSEEPPR